MKFTILGSGGCVALPKPLCQCNICREAREKGRPYARYGCSLYLHDAHMLFDTPEDITHALNAANIEQVDAVVYSHMDPDHTLGMRVFEHLRLDWLKLSEGVHCQNPIIVYGLSNVLEDLNSIQSKLGSYMEYYGKVRNLLIQKPITDVLELQDIKISFLPVGQATVFVFEEGRKKVVYAPCDVKPFPQSHLLDNADILIIGNTIPCEYLKDGFQLSPGNFLSEDLFSMKEIIALKEQYAFKKVIITHLEEDWGQSYDDYLKLQEQYDDLEFAFDGMIIDTATL